MLSITFVGSDTWRSAGLAVLFGLIALLAATDLIADAGEGASLTHRLVEGFILLVGVVGLAVMLRNLAQLWRQTRRLEREAVELTDRLENSTAQAARWREETKTLLHGLGQAIDAQFRRWDLSPAEREVALMLLKGLSHKEIALLRQTSEATTRQQAASIYKKASLSGRNELSAFFLEDLLLPMEEA